MKTTGDFDFLSLLIGARRSFAYIAEGEDRKLISTLGNVEEVLGADLSELSGVCLNSFIHGLNLKSVMEGLGDAKPEAATFEYRLKKADGNYLWVKDTFKRKEGDTPVFEGIITDITAERRIGTGRTRFLRNLNRQLRTPMSTILGFIELSIDTLDEDDVVRGYLRTARYSAVSAIRMLNDASYMDRLSADAEKDGESVFCMKEMAEALIRYLRDKLSWKGTEFRLEYAEGTPDCFKGMRNSIHTAIYYMGEFAAAESTGGMVVLEVSYDRGMLNLSFTDTGTPLSRKEKKELLLKGSPGRAGTGIHAAKLMADHMGGNLSADSLDSGNRYILAVPMVPQECECGCTGICMKSSEYRPELKSDFYRGFNVLVAEDIKENADLLMFRLHRRGHRVSVAADGREAAEMFAADKYDLVIMDLHMPYMDGIKAFKKIKTLQHYNYVPVIGITSSILAKDRQTALEAGMDAVMTKPLDFHRLFEKMEQLVPPDRGFQTNSIKCVGEGELDMSSVSGYIDVTAGRAIWGSDILFAEALFDFSAKYADCCDVLASMINTNTKEAYRYVHTLKNIIADFACWSLLRKIEDIESWIFAGDSDVALIMLDELRSEMEVFMKAVESLKNNKPEL